MSSIFHRLVYGYVLIFVAAQALTGALLIYDNHSILIPTWRAFAGLMLLFIVTACVFRKENYRIATEGLAAGLILAWVSLFFTGYHPMSTYVAVRHVTPDGFIESDEVFKRTAPVVQTLESKGSRKSAEGGSFGIERYLYSPRIGILLGKSLGDGDGSPDIGYEVYGFAAWLFGIRVACEQFGFYAMNLTPLLCAYGGYCYWKKKPLKTSLDLDPIRVLFLTGPLVVGLLPLIGT